MATEWPDNVEHLSATFVVRRGVLPLEDHREMLRQQLDEIDEHLEAGRRQKAIKEFVDCISLAHGAIFEHADDPDAVIQERLDDISSRFDEIVGRPVCLPEERGSQ